MDFIGVAVWRVMAALIGICGGVYFVPPPRDLRYERAEAVSGADCPRSHGFKVCADQSRVLRVMVSSRKNLKAHARRYELNLYSEAGLCPDIDRYGDKLRKFGPYWKGHQLRYRDPDPDARVEVRPEADGRFRYEVYVFPDFPAWNVNGSQHVQAYDLRASTGDVCLALGGGNMTGGWYITNKVVVPRSDIDAALRVADPTPQVSDPAVEAGDQARVSTDPPSGGGSSPPPPA